MMRRAKWAQKRCHEETRRQLSNQTDPQKVMSLARDHQGSILLERIPALNNLGKDLAIFSQGKADFFQ